MLTMIETPCYSPSSMAWKQDRPLPHNRTPICLPATCYVAQSPRDFDLRIDATQLRHLFVPFIRFASFQLQPSLQLALSRASIPSVAQYLDCTIQISPILSDGNCYDSSFLVLPVWRACRSPHQLKLLPAFPPLRVPEIGVIPDSPRSQNEKLHPILANETFIV